MASSRFPEVGATSSVTVTERPMTRQRKSGAEIPVVGLGLL